MLTKYIVAREDLKPRTRVDKIKQFVRFAGYRSFVKMGIDAAMDREALRKIPDEYEYEIELP